MRLLVTGGAGYVGSHTCVSLLEAGHELVVLDDFSNSDSASLDAVGRVTGKRPEWVRTDIRDRTAVRKVVDGGRFAGVLHFAALKSAPESIDHPERYWDVNVGGMAVLLEAVLRAGVGRFIFSSSAIVYGDQESVPIPETAMLRPQNPYAHTKVAGEQMLMDIVRRYSTLRACILRYFNPIGVHPSGLLGENPRQPPSNLFPLLLRACRDDRIVDVYGNTYATPDGTTIRDYIHVMDVADGHLAALEALTTPAGDKHGSAYVFNLGTGMGSSVLEMIHAMEAASGRPIRTRNCPPRPGDIAISIADPTQSAVRLSWKARRTIEQACRDALAEPK